MKGHRNSCYDCILHLFPYWQTSAIVHTMPAFNVVTSSEFHNYAY